MLMGMTHRGFELCLLAVPTNVPTVRQALREFLGDMEMPDDRREEVMLAVNEACTNVVMHAYADGDGELTVRAGLTDGQVVVDVVDTGSGMGPRVDSPGLGVGLPMIVMLADSVQIDRPTGGGTHVKMRFGPRPAAG
jgi:anti-sigma regulatory factor (Ser/Thr protein kinase)